MIPLMKFMSLYITVYILYIQLILERLFWLIQMDLVCQRDEESVNGKSQRTCQECENDQNDEI